MMHAIFTLLLFCSWTLGLSQDQIFHSDWQTINIGIPIDALYHKDKLFTLSKIGLFSVINATTGDTIYRVKHNKKVEDTSRIIKFSNDLAVTIFNGADCHVIVWDISHSVPTIEFQLVSQTPIWDVALKKNVFYTIGYEGIKGYNVSDSLEIVYHNSTQNVESAKIFTDLKLNNTFLLLQTEKKCLLTDLAQIDKAQYIPDCRVSKAQFIDEESSFFCGSYYYKLSTRDNNEMIITDIPSHDLSQFQHGILMTNEQHRLVVNSDTLDVYDLTSPQVQLLRSYPNKLSESCKIKAFEFCENKLKVLCVSESEIFQYVNGTLLWSRDQSFINISDAIVVDKFVQSQLSDENYQISNSNFIFGYINRFFQNWKRFKRVFRLGSQDDNIFGLQKSLIVLSDKQKIGVFDMEQNSSNNHHLSFVIIPSCHIDELTTIDNVPYAVGENTLFKIDLMTKTLTPVRSNFKDLTQQNSAEYTAKHLLNLNKVKGYKAINDSSWRETWEFSPMNETIISFTQRTYDNLHVAQNGIILSNRSVLYKYLIPNIGVVTTHTTAENQIKIRLINLITGQVYANFSKSLKTTDFNSHDYEIVYEENFIIFTIYLRDDLDTEVCVIDLFESLTPNFKTTKSFTSYSAFQDTVLPSFATQCYLISGKQIINLAVSNTKNNIAVKEIIFGSREGQIFSIPKVILDSRRGGMVGDFNRLGNTKLSIDGFERIAMSIHSQKHANSIVNNFMYDPIVSPHPNYVISHYRDILVTSPKKSFAFTIPTELESTTYYVFVGNEIFVTKLRPSGSFDKLTSSFNTTAVAITMSILFLGIFFVLPRARRTGLLSLWGL